MSQESLVVYSQPPQNPLEQLNKRSASLQDGFWVTKNMKDVCPNIKEWKLQELFLNENKHPPILKEIIPIKFPNLGELLFCGNNISSVEGLSRIHMPAMKLLCLHDNEINIARDLKKGSWPVINTIGINKNKIKQISFLSTIKLNKLEDLWIEYQVEEEQLGPDISHLAKWDVKEIQRLWIKNSSRIKQQKSIDVLKSKFSGMTVNPW